jgi:uncharacterized protein (TIGR02246 family)
VVFNLLTYFCIKSPCAQEQRCEPFQKDPYMTYSVSKWPFARRIGYRAAALALAAYFCFTVPLAVPQDERGNSDERDLSAKLVETLVSAWNKNDAETIAKLFLPDAVLITPTGSVIRSRPQIRKRIIDERQGRLKETTLQNTVEDVSLLNDNTAVVKGSYRLDGMKILGFKTAPEGPFILRQKKQQGRWLISRAEILRKKAD